MPIISKMRFFSRIPGFPHACPAEFSLLAVAMSFAVTAMTADSSLLLSYLYPLTLRLMALVESCGIRSVETVQTRMSATI